MMQVSVAPICGSYSNLKPQGGTRGQSSHRSQVKTISLGNEEFVESCSTNSGAADICIMKQRMETGFSKWQSKGRRSTRSINKRRQATGKSLGVDDESNFSRLDGGFDHRAITKCLIGKYQRWNGNISYEVNQRVFPYHQSRFTTDPKYQFAIRNNSGDSAIYEVNLEVKASYRPQQVPYISLLSKLTGQPIIGHPLTVEVLNDGYCDNLLLGAERYISSSSCDSDEYPEENVSKDIDMDYELKPKVVGGRIHMPSKSIKSRKNGLLCDKKMRKLSWLMGARQRSKDEKKPLIVKIKDPSVACVPLKVVFSRINASFNGSMQQARRVK